MYAAPSKSGSVAVSGHVYLAGQALALGFENVLSNRGTTSDAKLWTAGIAVVCGALLLKMLERVSLVMVFEEC